MFIPFALGRLQCPCERTDYNGARYLVTGLSGDNNTDASGKWPTDRFIGFASHDDGMPHGKGPEMLQIGRKMPRQRIVTTNNAIFCHRHQGRDAAISYRNRRFDGRMGVVAFQRKIFIPEIKNICGPPGSIS